VPAWVARRICVRASPIAEAHAAGGAALRRVLDEHVYASAPTQALLSTCAHNRPLRHRGRIDCGSRLMSAQPVESCYVAIGDR
jgi:hypothetical protein